MSLNVSVVSLDSFWLNICLFKVSSFSFAIRIRDLLPPYINMYMYMY